MKEFICLNCRMVFSAGADYAKCCGELEQFDAVKHAQLLISSSNAWQQIAHVWDDNLLYQEVLQKDHNNGSFGAAKTLKHFVNELLESNEFLKEEMKRRAEDNKREWDLAKPILADPRKAILEAAWERVSTGDINAVVGIDTFPSNIRMFDYPRYTWSELENLIKGIQR